MESEIDRRVRELIKTSLGRSEFRVALVLALLKEGLYEQAAEQAVPLVGTEHDAWFLYARAWHYLSLGRPGEADRTLSDAYARAGQSACANFSFTERGRPKLTPPFHSPYQYGDPTAPSLPDDAEFLNYSTAIFRLDCCALLSDISRNIREYKQVFKGVALCIEKIIHHDSETVAAALGACEIDHYQEGRGNSFLLLAVLTDAHLKLVAEALWRVCLDWNYPETLCEVVSYLHFILEEDEIALELADRGLRKNRANLICGNVRALVLNRGGVVYHADKQWRETLRLNPQRSATNLVLGHQALVVGALDVALRYFHEAVATGDNPVEAERFLEAALDCI